MNEQMNVFFSILIQDQKRLPPSNRFKTLSDEGVHTLLILEAKPEDAGVYHCEARNQFGSINCGARLAVKGGRNRKSFYYSLNICTGFQEFSSFRPGQKLWRNLSSFTSQVTLHKMMNTL